MYIKIHDTKCYIVILEVVKMTTSNDESKIVNQAKRRKEREKKKLGEQNRQNSIEAVTQEVLHSKKTDQKTWLSFQDIIDGFENKTILIDYWNKSDEFEKDLLQALNVLETKGKIEKKTVGQESYFSSKSEPC